MGVNYNPRVVTNGLVLCLDAANANKSARGFKNLTDLSTWTLGTGGTANYPMVGDVSENQRILDTGPFGYSSIVWDTPSTGVDSDADGGFTGPYINIDPTKLYRFSIWMRRKTVGNGSSYLGCHAWDVVTQQVLNRSNGATQPNPYFLGSNYWGNVNDWYLITGHIWPAGSGTGSSKADSGIYTTAGTKISGTTDYVWQATNTYTYIRSFLYYSTDITTNQQLYQPRVDLCDGTEPTVAELIAGVGSKWYDLSGTNHGNILNSAALYNSAGYMNFDGVDDNITTSYVPVNTGGSISVWFRLNAHKDYNTIFDNALGANDWEFWVYGTGVARFRSTADNSDYILDSDVLLINTWYNFVITWTSTEAKMYKNGLLFAQDTTAGTKVVPSTLNFGGGNAGNTKLNGYIANAFAYNRSLSAVEVLQNFNATRGRFGI